MKTKFFLLFIFHISYFIFPTLSQNIKGGIIGGMNATQVNGDNLSGYHKFGINIGGIAIVPIKKKISVSLEILYSEKGSRSGVQERVTPYKLKLNYIDVPVLFNYQDKEKVMFSFGASFNTLVKFKEYDNDLDQTPADNPYAKREYTAIVSGTYFINKHVAFNIRYTFSIFQIGERLLEGKIHKQYNNVVPIRLMYLF